MILAGGPATRFDGLPKGLQTVGGERIIDRVARSLQSVSDRLLIISNDPRAHDWVPGAEVAGDVLPGRASVVGLHAALVQSGGDVVVVAWDMPFVPGALLTELGARLKPGVTAVVPTGPRGPEPVCAAYAAAALPHIERLVATGGLKLSTLVDSLPGVERMTEKDVARLGDPEAMFFNVNTPADRERAEAIARAL